MVNFWPYTFDNNAVTYLFVYLSLSKNVTQEICVHPTIGNFLGYITAFRLEKKNSKHFCGEINRDKFSISI